jgi:hypothetical protein
MDTGVLIDARTFLGNVWKLSAPYWRSEEKGRAWSLLAAIVALSLFSVYLLVLLNDWNRQFFNAIEQKDERDFFVLLVYFCYLAALFIAAVAYETYLEQMLRMRWRIWLTKQYLGDWLGNQVYYRLELESRGTDNPDQRIAEDLRLFTENTLRLALGLLRETVTVASFAMILWNLSGALPLTIGGTEMSVPGYLLWTALAYAVVGSLLTHYVGRRLIGLNFERERYEADFRYSLVRLRENAEGVALYRGEAPEKTALLERIEWIRANWWEVMRYTKRLNIHRRVRPGRCRLPLFRRRTSVLLGCDSARRSDADRQRVQPGADLALVVRRQLRDDRDLEGKRRSPAHLPSGAGGRGGRAGAPRRDRRAARRGPCGARRASRPRASERGDDQRADDPRRHVAHDRARRAAAHLRAVRLGQEHAVPCARRHLAVWTRQDPGAAGCAGAVPAAEALHPDRAAARRGRLSRPRGRVPG